MGHRIQRLRRHVSSRVGSTMQRIKTRSHTRAGFPAAPSSDRSTSGPLSGAIDDPKASFLQLHNTIIRALLAVPVLYEPGKLLRRSKDAVLIITGADLVLVKLDKAATARSHSNSFTAEPTQGDSNAAVAAADSGGANSPELSQANVLAQHELNKLISMQSPTAPAADFLQMIKCQVVGSCLELEFIVTGSARFKVSAAALGFTSSGLSEAATSNTPAQGDLDIEAFPAADTGAAADTSVEAAEGQQASSSVREPAAANTAGAPIGGAGAARFSAPGNLDGTSLSAPAGDCGSSTNDVGSSSTNHVHLAAYRHSKSSSGAPGHRRSSSTAGAVLHGIGRSASYVKSLGSSVSAYVPTWEDASRSVGSTVSSFRMVKTDEGDYWVCVESFSLQFRDVSTCQVAADLLQTGKANMRSAVDWLKQGLPFKPDFAVTHITELASNRTGPETLLTGPINWNTDLQLPVSWAQAISSAEVQQEQPLLTQLMVPGGPAAFKIHISTPAGLAVATLVPELMALLAQHPHSQGQLLAVPVHLSSHQAAGTGPSAQLQTHQQQDSSGDQLQQLHPGDNWGVDASDQDAISRYHSFTDVPGVGAGMEEYSSMGDLGQPHSHGADVALHIAAGTLSEAAAGETAAADGTSVSDGTNSSRIRRVITIPSRSYASAKVAAKGLLKKVVTFKEQPSNNSYCSDRSISISVSSPLGASAGRFSASSDEAGTVPGHTQDSRSAVGVLTNRYFRRCKSQPAALDSFAAANDVADDHLLDTASDVDRGAASEAPSSPTTSGRWRTFGSSGDLVGLQHDQSAAEPRRYSRFARYSRDQQQHSHSLSSGSSSGSAWSHLQHQQHQQPAEGVDQQEQHPSFVKEVYAVLHVQLCFGRRNGDSSAVLHTGGLVDLSAATATQTESAAAGTASDIASGVIKQGTKDVQLMAAAADANVVAAGHAQGPEHHQQTLQQQQMLSFVGLLTAVLCTLALLFLHSAGGPLLVCLSLVLNTACMAGSLQPAQMQRAMRRFQQLLQVRWPSHSESATSSAGQQDHAVTDASAAEYGDGLMEQPLVDSPASGSRRSGISGCRLRLLGAGFVREPLGLLQEQICAFGLLQDRTSSAVAAALPRDVVDASEADVMQQLTHQDVLAGDDCESLLMLVSSPEPVWMTPDWRQRILAARPTAEERRKLASYVHGWRMQYGADRLLKQQPPHFAWFQQQLELKPLLVTPQGHVVLLLKMASLVQTSRNLAAAGLTADDMTAYCGFIWSFMFEVLAPGAYPSGRLIMVTDMRDVKLGQAVGEGQVGARAFGAVCSAWPERLVRCLVLGTPSWFNMLYRLLRPHLSPSTSAKIQVYNLAEGAAELALCLRPDMVPKQYGGRCTLHLDEYPAQKQLLEYVAGLQCKAQRSADASSGT